MPAEPKTGRELLNYFLQCHEDGIRNRSVRGYILRHHWTLTELPVEKLPDWEDDRFIQDDPYGRALDNSEAHVDKLVADIRDGVAVQPAIVDANGVILDGNHRALACRIAGVPLPAYVPAAFVRSARRSGSAPKRSR